MGITLLLHTQASTSLSNSIMTLVAFILLLLIVGKYAWQPIMKILAEREARIQGDLSEAQVAKEESQAANESAQLKLKEAREKANQIILNTKKQALQIQDQMLSDTKAEVLRMKEAASQDIQAERHQMMQDMRHELTDISIEIAEKILQREIQPDDYVRLVDDFIQGMDE